MNTKRIMAILFFLILPIYAKSEDIPAVNAVLPKDHQIWPLPKPNASIAVNAKWKSGREVKRMRKGDCYRIWRLIEYSVDSVRMGEFLDSKISFIMEDSWPTPESGIMLKKLDDPFIEGTRAVFYLNRSHDGKVYDVQSYEIWKGVGSPQFHRKPE
jgi:hypothetical protein